MSKVHLALKKAEEEKKRGTSKKEGPVEGKHDPSAPHVDQHLVAFLKPESTISEQYRKLRTVILEHSNNNHTRCILVTSSVMGEGKTITSLNLATSIARGIEEHVLLVDADLRRPSLHNYLGLDPAAGLSDYLTGDMDLASLLVKTPIPKLTLLPAGPVSDKSSELFHSEKMRNLIEEVKSRYNDRYIVIDSTPIISTADSDILAQQVDGIVFIVRAGMTPREVVKRSLAGLEKKKIIGLVLNDVDLRAAGYNYGYCYYDNDRGNDSSR